MATTSDESRDKQNSGGYSQMQTCISTILILKHVGPSGIISPPSTIYKLLLLASFLCVLSQPKVAGSDPRRMTERPR